MKRLLSIVLIIAVLAGFAYGLKAQTLTPYAFTFTGKWNPSENPLLLDDYGLQDIQNLRKDGKHFKGVSGHTVVNSSSAFVAYPVILNGFHFKKDQPAETHVIIYAADTMQNPTAGGLYQNTTAIPSQGNFSATALISSVASDVWRFSAAPAGNMVAANGDYTYIWGGNELEATAFYTSSASITYSVTNSNDFSEALSNTRTSSDQVATLSKSGGIDAYTQLLLHMDGANGGTVFTDSSANAFPSAAVGNAVTVTASYKFGTASGYFDGTNSYIITGTATSFNFLHQLGTTGKWTVDGWIQCDNFAQIHTIINTGDWSSGGHGVYIGINTNRTISVYIAAGVGGSPVLDFTTTGTYPNDTGWHHVEIWYSQDDSPNSRVFVDGAQLSGTGTKTAQAPSTANSTRTLEIGARGSLGNNFHTGHIDELRISSIVRHYGGFSIPAAPYGIGSNRFLVGSKRPLQGVKFYVQSGNAVASGMTVQEWQGTSGWSNLSITDNTSSGGKTLAQTGTVTWTPTNAAQARHINGLSLYWYYFYFSAGQTTLYYVTTDAPITTIKNIWDGIEGYVVKCLKWDGTTYRDYTDAVGDSSQSTYADLSSLQTTHYLLVGFLEPQQGIDITFVAGSENATASTTMYSNYWSGAAWVGNYGLNDGTATSTTSLSKGGVASWQGVTPGTEAKLAISDEYPLYYYKINFAAQLDADVKIAEIRGISQPSTLSNFKFSETFQNRLFLFNEKSGLKNAAIYSNANAPDIMNGDDAGSVIFGDKTELTAAKTIYNVFQNTAVEQMLVTKAHETWRLAGNDPSTWELKRMSANIGCVAPLSMVSAEVTETATDVKRSVAIWVSDKGPVMSDGASIYPVYEDVKTYWDPNSSLYISAALQSKSMGWYDPALQSYKLLVASGSTATYLNTELEYSLKYKEWTKLYRENAAGANPLQSGWQVHDTNGLGYTYGGAKDGYVYRLENGNNWNSVANIAQYIHTKDLILDNQAPLFRKSTAKYLRTAYKQKSTGDISIAHYGDRVLTVSGSSGQVGPAMITNAVTTYYNSQSCNLGPFLWHSFKFSATTNCADGLELTGFGTYYESQTTFR